MCSANWSDSMAFAKLRCVALADTSIGYANIVSLVGKLRIRKFLVCSHQTVKRDEGEAVRVSLPHLPICRSAESLHVPLRRHLYV